jgi:hypothetical protein
MATTVTKLANKLPRLAIPTKKPNGDVLPCTLDPYLESTSGIWTTNPNAKQIKDIGISAFPGNAVKVVLSQSVLATLSKWKMYVELEECNYSAWFEQGGVLPFNLINDGVGAYIIDSHLMPGAIAFYFAFLESYYTPDPYFKKVPVGVLPTDAVAVAPSWTAYFGSGVRKDTDGSIRISSLVQNSSAISHKNSFPNNTPIEINLTVDKVALGTTILVYQSGAAFIGEITAPGTYSFRSTWLTANPVILMNGVVGVGRDEHKISYFQIKAASHSGPTPDELFIQPTCIFAAEASLFDEIIKPSTYVASNRIDSGGALASQVYAPKPELSWSPYLPPVGNYVVGDIIRNKNFVSGQPYGWKCVTSGCPGTWAPLATVP